MRKFIKDYLAKEYDNYVKDLEALTNIDSGNGDLEGTEAANKFVAAKMQALGAETEFRYNDRGCHLISRLKGKGTQTVLLVAHVDTVFKRGEAAKRPFRVDENGFAWGPGVGDDKATVMEVIYGLAALKEAGFDDRRRRQPDCRRHCGRAFAAGRFCRYYGRCAPELGNCNPA